MEPIERESDTMGIDLLMDVAAFFVIYKVFWHKSRTRHMGAKGLSGEKDSAAFALFVALFCASVFGSALYGDFCGMFTPFTVFVGIGFAYLVSTRAALGAGPARTPLASGRERN